MSVEKRRLKRKEKFLKIVAASLSSHPNIKKEELEDGKDYSASYPAHA